MATKLSTPCVIRFGSRSSWKHSANRFVICRLRSISAIKLNPASDVTRPPWKLTMTGGNFSGSNLNSFGVGSVVIGVILDNCEDACSIYIFAVFDLFFCGFCEKSGLGGCGGIPPAYTSCVVKVL